MSFDHLAPHYRWMEAVLAGGLLQRCRTAFLDEIDGEGRVLILGEGRGRFLEALRRRHPRVEVTVVDASRRMLEWARRDLVAATGSDTGVRFVHARADQWPGDGAFDAVATHFFLDCFPPADLGPLVHRIASWTRPGAPWLLSDFCVPEQGWRRWRARAVHQLMYTTFRAVTDVTASRVTPPDAYLEGEGFELRRRVHANFGLLHADLWTKEKGPAHGAGPNLRSP